MPANLTHDFERAEARFREATDDAERLDALQEMLRTIPKHKGTDKMQADIKRRISRLRKTAETKKGGRRGPDPFHVSKGGAGQVILVGAPNVGKSALVATTTKAAVKVGAYPYTTSLPAPGMWPYEDTQIQLVDTPPMTVEHAPTGLMGAVRLADVVVVVVDAAGDALEQADMVLGLLDGKGLALRSVPRSALDPGQPGVRSGLLVATHADAVAPEDTATLRELYAGRLEVWPVSAVSGEGLPALSRRLWELLAVIRVYTKQPGRNADRDKPFLLPAGATVGDLARQIHRELPETMKYARIWGEGHHDGQQVHRNEPLGDRNVLEIRE